MEAGVTTATRRLRRAGVAGLATITTVGGIALSAGPAFAWGAGGAIVPTASATPNVSPGTTGAAAGDLSLQLPNDAWNIGDKITETIVNTGNCTTAANTIGFAAAPTATASLPTTAASTSTKPTVSVALSSVAGACTTAGVKDTLTLTFTNSGDNSADANGTPTIKLSPMTFNLGANPTGTGGNITLAGVATGSGTVPTQANIDLAVIQDTSATVSASVGASDGATVNVGTITATDVVGNKFGADITFTLTAGDTWATKGTLTAPSGVATDSGTITGNVLKYVITSGTFSAGAKFTLSGATATVNGAGSHKVTVTTNGGTAIGSAVQVAFVAAPTRIGGADRYATAALIYNQKYGAATSAVIASGANFPDALSATALAKAKSTGVLLTDPNSLSGATQQALITDGPVTTVYIVGGPAAVSANVYNQIAALKNSAGNAINVIRVYGADRYATNAAVDLQAGVNLTTIGGNTAIVATGENFADALAVGPAIYQTGWPLILTPSADLNSTAKSTIAALGISNAVIVGGPKAVSATAEASLKTAGVTVLNRLAGDTRTLTAAEIAKWELTPAANTFAETGYTGNKGLGFSGATVNIARGDTYPDALASGAWLGNAGVLQVLLLTDSPTALGAGIPALLAGANAAPPAGYGTTNINAIGLAAALSTPTVTAAVGAIS
jgi:putative cell wall-binding protein